MPATTLGGSVRAPPYIVIPGTKRAAPSRKVASNTSCGIKALVVPDKRTHKQTLLKVSLMRERRVLFLTLDGHRSDIVDLEFLRTCSDATIHVLGSCDRDGVVFLWFLYVALDKLNIEVNLRLLKKYSFFTLRRSTTAFYTRIRLAGKPAHGTMVLVPNDGANVRVISFSCDTQLSTTAADPGVVPRIEQGQGEGQVEGEELEMLEHGHHEQGEERNGFALAPQQGDERGVSSKSTLNSSALAQARRDAVDELGDDDMVAQQQARGIREVLHVDVVRNAPGEEDEEEEEEESEESEVFDESTVDEEEGEVVEEVVDVEYDEELESAIHPGGRGQELVKGEHAEFEQEHHDVKSAAAAAAYVGASHTASSPMTDALIVEGEGLAGYTG